MKKSTITLAAIATIAVAVAVILGVNLVNTTNNFNALFKYHSAECEYIRYEDRDRIPADFEYSITCDEATQYELEDYINCSKNKGTYCTVDDLI